MKTTVTTHEPKEAQRILSSLDMALALWEIRFNLMKRLENFIDRDEEVSSGDLLIKLREELFDIMDGIDIDNMIE